MNIKRYLIMAFLMVSMAVSAESPLTPAKSPVWTIKTNGLYWASATMNLGVEIATGQKNTLDISGGYNPFTFNDDKKFKHWLIQPEFRWWLCEKFNGHFLGVHAHYAEYNVGGIKLPFGMFPTLEDHRYEGRLYGAGGTYGYQWVLGDRWNLQAAIGIGYAYLDYDKFECGDCGKKIKSDDRHYFGVTKAAVSIIYVIK